MTAESVKTGTSFYTQTPEALSADLVPAGVYRATLQSVRMFQNPFGGRWAFQFEITEGEHAGNHVALSTGSNLNRKSQLGRTLAGLLGRELTEHELLAGMNPADLEGAECQIVLGRGTDREGKPYSKVENVL